MGKAHQLIAIAQLEFIVALGVPALGKHCLHLVVVEIASMVLILGQVPIETLVVVTGNDAHIRLKVFGIGQIEQGLFVLLHELGSGK